MTCTFQIIVKHSTWGTEPKYNVSHGLCLINQPNASIEISCTEELQGERGIVNIRELHAGTNYQAQAMERCKPLHGEHSKRRRHRHCTIMCFTWKMKTSFQFSEIEGFIMEIQDNVINAKKYKNLYTKRGKDKCRKCHLISETIEHITSDSKLIKFRQHINTIPQQKINHTITTFQIFW